MYGSTRSQQPIEEGEVDNDGNMQNMSKKQNKGVLVIAAVFLMTIASVFLVYGGNTSISGSSIRAEFSEIVSESTFVLSSPQFNDQDSLPSQYTCNADDGVGYSPPFEWSGAPEGTVSYAFILHSAKHWDWGLFNIPASQSSLDEGCSKPFSLNYTSCGGYALGSSPDRPMYYYTPPCSEGRGAKSYFFVIYALSESIVPLLDPNSDDDGKLNFYQYAGYTVADMLVQIENITLASATMTTSFTRWTRDDDPTQQ